MVATGTTGTPVNQNVLTLRNIEHYFANSGDISSKTNTWPISNTVLEMGTN